MFLLTLSACTEAESNLALGTLARNRITRSATAAETIINQPIAEGIHVETGDLLAQLAKWNSEALPAIHFVRMIRGIVLTDATRGNVPADRLFLLRHTLVGLLMATLKFRKALA